MSAPHAVDFGKRMLPQLLAGFAPQLPDLEVTGVQMDSRRVASGNLFLACRGGAQHGLKFLDQAVAQGAAAVAWEPAEEISVPAAPIPMFAVDYLSARAGEISARFYGHPSSRLFTVGITGTDGKTSTAYLIAQALDVLGDVCAYFGTLGYGRVGALAAATHTTPDPVQMQAQLARVVAEGAHAVALEVSSHALDQDRISGVELDVAVLTNLGRDHLDYHGDISNYAAAKRRLFQRPELAAVVFNRDDAYGRAWAHEAGSSQDCVVYGIDGELPLSDRYVLASSVKLHPRGLEFVVNSSWGKAHLCSGLLGRFNVYNLLAALSALLLKGIALDRAVAALAQATTVPGRIEGFRGPNAKALVVVDYAHTPQALEQVLIALRAHTPGRLICVFGCGGDRDRGKRPLMGAVAEACADEVIVTDDNPRSEVPQFIVAEILAGMRDAGKVRTLHDRARAIEAALASAGADDVVLVAGKGHEETQTYGSEARAFSDRAYVAGQLGAKVRA